MKEHPMWEAGCSALSWSTQDGKHLFARNMDFTGMAPGTSVTFAPRGSAYELCSGQPSGYRAQYAAVGIGLMAGQPDPVRGRQRARTHGCTAVLPLLCALP